MPSTDDATKIHMEADRIREEMRSLMAGLNGRHPTKAAMRRARDLRERTKALGEVTERLVLAEMATWLALKQRVGRDPIDGDDITAADETRATEILAGFGLDAL